MEEISSDILFGEVCRELHSAYNKSLRVCLLNLKCKTCPYYDKNIENKYNTKCLALLIGKFALKLMQIANGIEEKGE